MTVIIKIGIFVLNIVYAVIKLCPTQKKIVMISRQSNIPSSEFKMIQKEIYRQDKKTKVVLLCKTLDGGVDSTIFNKIKYAFHMLVQMYHIATAKVVILDSYCIVVSILNHKKSLKVIQMWHSMGTMKKFGYTALDTAEGSSSRIAHAMKMHHNYDYAFASAEAYKDHLASGFNCDKKKILTMPLPRLDLLQSRSYALKTQEKVYEKYPVLREKPVIMYCPTFRKDEADFEKACYDLVNAVDTDKYNLVMKLHPLSKVQLNDNVIQAKEFSSFDILFVADYVISDYSCIVYEAAVRDIPLYFYNFDMELYTDGRGLAIDYEHELPGVTSKDAKVIAEAIDSQQYDMEELKAFTEKYIRPTKNATKDIVDFVWKFME